MKDKTILITGGTSGIGYEIVKSLYKDNKLIVVAKDKKKLDKLLDDFDNISIYQADLSIMEDISNVSNKILNDFEFIDVLINNAAIQYTPMLFDADFEYEMIEKEISVNFTAVCSLTYLFLPLLLKSKDGIILNVNSGLALAPKTTSAVYCATKGAVNIFTQSLRNQLEYTNVSVLQVFLELVDTDMTKGRGKNKMEPKEAAKQIIYGIENKIEDHDIGKVKLLRLLLRGIPSIAKSIMKKY
jgi:uncharacterized oxidoreductase